MIFGITGGTGCGKTTALQAIRELGGIIIDCDAVYHVLLQTDKKMLAAIEKRFPGTVIDGVLDRKKLGPIVFSNEQALLDSAGAYFVHRNGHLLGLGWLEGERLLAVAAMELGAGERVMHTLMSLIEGETMTLEVASTNERAIRLYEKLGFLKVREVRKWYRT